MVEKTKVVVQRKKEAREFVEKQKKNHHERKGSKEQIAKEDEVSYQRTLEIRMTHMRNRLGRTLTKEEVLQL